MNYRNKNALTILVLFGCLFSNIAESQPADVAERIRALDWKTESGSYPVMAANAVLSTDNLQIAVIGKDAEEFSYLSEGHRQAGVDAVVVNIGGPAAETFVTYVYEGLGHVQMDDWEKEVDPSDLLGQIKKDTQEANRVREPGYAKLYVDGWLEEPFLDRNSAIVYWAMKGHDENGGYFVNAKAMKLGRHGVTHLVWVGSEAQFHGAKSSLTPSLDAYGFNDGFQYADYSPGMDTVAALGVGALVVRQISGKTTAKAAGAGILVMIAAFAKKLWFLLILPFIWLWRTLKRALFGGRENQNDSA